MLCPRCNGRGSQTEYKKYPCGESYKTSSNCGLCAGTGQVIYVRSEYKSGTCGRCNGTGRETKKEEVWETYKTSGNRTLRYKYTDITCTACSGRGTWRDSKPTKYYKPDYTTKESGGGCFITTATCQNIQGLEKSETILNDFRFFRDNWLKEQKDGIKIIDSYYKISPPIVKKIDNHQDKEKIYNKIWKEYLSPIHQLLLAKKNQEAFEAYFKMVKWLETV